MKGGFYVAAALIVGALLAQLLLADPGHVAIAFRSYLVETTVPVLALILAGAYIGVRLLARLWNARRSLSHARERRRETRARQSLVRGLLELAEGNWNAAEQTLSRTKAEGEAAAAHFLAAARAAELQGAADRRNEWIAHARTAAPAEAAAALVTQAEFELKHKQFEAALAALEQLEASGEQNPRGLLLLARVYRHLARWDDLAALEPRLAKIRQLPAATRAELLREVHFERLQAAALATDAKQLDAAWRKVPRSASQDPEIMVAYARGAIACGEHRQAEKTLKTVLNREWNETAVVTFGDLETDEPLATLETAEGWLRAHSEDSTLLLTCARLSIRAELYGKARSYLEASLAIKPRLEAYQLLANLLDQLGEREHAIAALNDALTMAVGRRANLPRVRRRFFVERRRGDERRREG
jgi:HemY protein